MPPHTGTDLGTAPAGDDGDGHRPNGGRPSDDRGQKSGGTSAAVDPEGVLLASPSFGGRSHVSGDHDAAVDPAGVLLASASFCGSELNDHERNTPFDRRHSAGASFGNPVFGRNVPGNYGTHGNADGAGRGEKSARQAGWHWQREAARAVTDAPADENDGSLGGDATGAEEPWCALPEATLRALAEEALQAIAEGSDGDETGSDVDETGSARADNRPAAWGAGAGPVAASRSFSSAGPVAESRSFSSASTEVVSNRSKPRPPRRQRKDVMLVHGGGFDWSSDSS